MGWTDHHGEFHRIYDHAANPAFKPIADLVSRLGLSTADLGMTVRAADAEEERQAGMLQAKDVATEALADFSQRMLGVMQGARDQLARADAAKKADPVFIQHQASGGDA